MSGSRRRFLANAAAVGALLSAGCAGAASSSSDDGGGCRTSASEHGSERLFGLGPHVEPDDEDVLLVVPLERAAVREHGVDTVAVLDGNDELLVEIPVGLDGTDAPAGKYPGTDVAEYAHRIGERPFNGRYRLLARSGGERVDALTIAFTCGRA